MKLGINHIGDLVKASFSLIGVRTTEELLLTTRFYEAAKEHNLLLGAWTSKSGLVFLANGDKGVDVPMSNTGKLQDLIALVGKGDLRSVKDNRGGGKEEQSAHPKYNGTIIMVHDFWGDLSSPLSGVALTRQITDALARTVTAMTSLVFVAPDKQFESLPELLKTRMTMLDMPLPGREDRKVSLSYLMQSLHMPQASMDEELKDRLVDAGAGLTKLQFEDALGLAAKMTGDGKILNKSAVEVVFATKIAHVEEGGLLQYKASPGSFARVQGLEIVHEFAKGQRAAMTEQGRLDGVKRPKGVLLAGPPGCGKTMVANAIAEAFGCPLYSFDPGRAQSAYVGGTESLMRQVLELIDSLGPCVILIDEIEKYYNKVGLEGHNASPSSQKSFGTLMTWMNDRCSQAYLVATTNNPLLMPPALYRRGRFDKVFSVGLPNLAARIKIVEKVLTDDIGLSLPSNNGILTLVGQTTKGFSGAELDSLTHEAYDSVWVSLGAKGKPAPVPVLTALLALMKAYKPQSTFSSSEEEEIKKLTQEFFTPATVSDEEEEAVDKILVSSKGRPLRGRSGIGSGNVGDN